MVELISFNLWSQITERGSFASHANLFQVQKVEGLEPCRNPTAFTEGAGKWPAEEQTWTNLLPTGYTAEVLPGLPALCQLMGAMKGPRFSPHSMVDSFQHRLRSACRFSLCGFWPVPALFL